VYAGLTPAKFMWMFFNFPPYRFGEFILGMLLARAVSLGLRIPRPSIALAIAVVGLIGVAWSLLRYTLDTHTYASRPIVALIVLPFFALVILAGATIDLTPETQLVEFSVGAAPRRVVVRALPRAQAAMVADQALGLVANVERARRGLRNDPSGRLLPDRGSGRRCGALRGREAGRAPAAADGHVAAQARHAD
jgi:hypothetical protein